jgi:hypothetical protein
MGGEKRDPSVTSIALENRDYSMQDLIAGNKIFFLQLLEKSFGILKVVVETGRA